ncbi:MAG TPA: hypothetical protein VFS88_03085 [Micavibrio sp.]|nr:hypothetical protein [Micavibrio sp.]
MRKLSEVMDDSANRMNSLEAKMNTIWNGSGFDDLLSNLNDTGFTITENKKIDSLAKTYEREVNVQKGYGTYFSVSVNINADEKFTYQAAFETDKGYPVKAKPESYNSLADIQVHIGQWLLENEEKFQRHDQMTTDIKRQQEERNRPLLQRLLLRFQ